MEHTLPPLPYEYDELEPHIDKQTMMIHHTKHHQTYVDKLNAAIKTHTHCSHDILDQPVEQLLRHLHDIPDDIQNAVRNHGGGHANHTFFWNSMSPSPKQPDESLAVIKAIKSQYGSFDDFQRSFSDAAAAHFGSGWAWLVVNKEKQLHIYTTDNQDSPLMHGNKPIIGLDVWEHAYYLKHQNKRPAYIESFWNVLDWEKVNTHFQNAMR